MSETEFTKGPLGIEGPSLGDGSNDDGGDYAICDNSGAIIGEAIYKTGPGEHYPARNNALLWAAAPKMYEALDRIVAKLCHPTATVSGVDAAIGMEALAEARGGEWNE